MKYVKKIIQPIKDENLSIQERMFRLLTLIGLIGMAIAVVVGIVFGESTANSIAMCLCLISLLGIVCVTLRCHKIQAGAIVLGCILMYMVMPANFLTTGGLYGGAPGWNLLVFLLVALLVEGRMKYILVTSGLVVGVVCYLVAYYYPSVLVMHTVEMAYIDSALTMVIVAVFSLGMILFQNGIYRSMNKRLRQQKQEIEELNQAQNRFFSSMSHEIRTPINTIIGLNEMILRETVSDEIAADAGNIQAASRMLLTLINDILDMSKMESGKMELSPGNYDTGAMLSEIVNMIWVQAQKKGLEFHIDVDRTMPARLWGDDIRIKQVLVNVLNNAVKYTQNGKVTLSIQCREQKNRHVWIAYSVTDTGMGIRKEDIPYLFSAFKRVDSEKNRHVEGTGLGLAIVKQLVELMGGDISVNSVYTKGTTFIITIPQEIVSGEEIGEIDFDIRRVMNAGDRYRKCFEAPMAHVLLVDDNEMNLMVEEKLLRDTKVQTETARGGAECLQKTLQNQYDVILMDHLMPEMDGIECLREIRAQTGGLNRETPVVILTANAGGEYPAIYKREGFAGYLTKPVTGRQMELELLKHLPKGKVALSVGQDTVGVMQTPFIKRMEKKLDLLISVDSVADLPKEMTDRWQMAVMPYRVVTEGGEFIDGQEVGTDGVLSYIQAGRRARSEAPATVAYEAFFAEQLLKAQYVIHLTMSAKVSKGYENAGKAAEAFDNVEVIDTGHLSSGMGLIALQAAQCAAEGMPREAVAEKIRQMQARIRTSFIVDDTVNLLRAGRISPGIHAICRALMIHPVLKLKDGKMIVGTVMLGSQKAVWEKYIQSVLRRADRIDKDQIFITHAGLSCEQLEEIETAVRKRINVEKIVYQKASPAISINCGPGAFGILFRIKDNG